MTATIPETGDRGALWRGSGGLIVAEFALLLLLFVADVYRFVPVSKTLFLFALAWIEAAKQQETKRRRLQEAIGLLAAGKKLGLK